MGNTQYIGQLGENIAVRFLSDKGFDIIERNFRQKWGEIDIIAKKGGVLHFVEVKSIQGNYRAEENVHTQKIKRLKRTILTYLNGKDIEFQFSVIVVHINLANKTHKTDFHQNIIL
jgi:putative endonuclease